MNSSESDSEAQQSVSTLRGVIDELLAQNQDIYNRFKGGDETGVPGALLDMNSPKAVDSDTNKDNDDDWVIVNQGSNETNDNLETLQEMTSQLRLEDEPEPSRVCERTQPSGANAWSNLSLADASVVPVTTLPLYLAEISNRQWYMFESVERVDPLAAGVPQAPPTNVPAIKNAPSQTGEDKIQPRHNTLFPQSSSLDEFMTRIDAEWEKIAENPTPGISVSPVPDDPVSLMSMSKFGR